MNLHSVIKRGKFRDDNFLQFGVRKKIRKMTKLPSTLNNLQLWTFFSRYRLSTILFELGGKLICSRNLMKILAGKAFGNLSQNFRKHRTAGEMFMVGNSLSGNSRHMDFLFDFLSTGKNFLVVWRLEKSLREIHSGTQSLAKLAHLEFPWKIFPVDEKLFWRKSKAWKWAGLSNFHAISIIFLEAISSTSKWENFRRELFSIKDETQKLLHQTRNTQTSTSYQR